MFELVKFYQIHLHLKTCSKYRNEKCRFRFCKFFTNKTIITQPSADSVLVDVELQKNAIKKKNNILKMVKNYIDNELNPTKKGFIDSVVEDYQELKSVYEILVFLEISKYDYEEALSISADNKFATKFTFRE